MMDFLGRSIRANFSHVSVPRSFPAVSSNKVITMTFMEGYSLAHFLAKKAPFTIDRVNLLAFARTLLLVYAYQIFELGVFQSDPHPGNLLINAEGHLTILDFGQVKVLSTIVRTGLAQLIIALAEDSPEAGEYLALLGIKLDSTTAQLKTLIAYILFDTRMDLPEARMNPFDGNLPAEIRKLRLSSIPQEAFMLIRVVALLRGILSSLDIDIHARNLWAPFAAAFLKAKKVPIVARRSERLGSTEMKQQMTELSSWLVSLGLPGDETHLRPLAITGVWSIEELQVMILSKDEKRIARALERFTPGQISVLERAYLKVQNSDM